MTNNNNRLLNFELLRILSMVMVTTLHFLSHSGFLTKQFCLGYYVGWFFETISLVATDVFVIISSFFLYDTDFSFKRLKKLYVKIITISLLGLIVAVFFGFVSFSLFDLSYFLPVLTRKWGFVNNYILFSLTIPIVNRSINNITKTEHIRTIVTGLVILSGGSFISSLFGVDYMKLHWGDTFIWFVFIYLVVAFFLKYKICVSKTAAYVLWLLPFVLQYASRVIISILSYKLFGEIKYAGLLYYGDLSILTFFSALGLFFLFKNIKITLNNTFLKKIILVFSSASFCVYLIQEHPILREVLWNYVFANKHLTIGTTFLSWFATVFALFFIAIIIDQLTKLLTSLLIRK